MNNGDEIKEYHVERLSDKNLADVEKLYMAVYGKAPRHNLFSMKYDTAFTTIQHIGFIAYNDSKMPIAFYAVIPCFIRFDDKIILAAQSADTMTHPEFRNKSLFTELAMLTYKLCYDVGIKFVFGFPNQNSLPGFINKLGWTMTERMDCFMIPCVAFSWKRVLSKFYPFKNWYKKYQQMLLKRYLLPQQGIPNTVFDDGFAGIYRDHHYLKYKSYTNNQVIKIGDSTLWIKINGVLLIGDVLVKPNDFGDMINKLKRLACKMGIKEIHFHANTGTTLHGLFAAAFPSAPLFPVIFKDIAGGTETDKIKFTSADIDTF
ncbi:MAG TPA: GNAT family N-acetyltransferase [Mucilaginibacter sp.]|jgi:hypothetical protein